MLKFIRPTTILLARKSCIFQSGSSSALVIEREHNRNYSSSFFETVSTLPPVLYAQDTLIHLHDASHMPWWTTIVLSTIISRTLVTIPLSIYQKKILAKVDNCREELPAIAEELKIETSKAVRMYKWNEEQAKYMFNRSMKQQWEKLIVRDNCHPAKSILLIVFQIPLWITHSYAIRNLVYGIPDPTSIESQSIIAELTLGGFAFIPNLIDVDHSFIIPIAFGIVNLLNIEINEMNHKIFKPGTKSKSYVSNFFRILTVLMAVIAASVPSALSLYWLTSSVFGLGQNFLLLSPRLRRFAKIPKTKTDIENPYKMLMLKFKERLNMK